MQTGEACRPARRLDRGYTYLGLLFAVALAGAGLASYGQDALQAAQRERERELIFRGEEIRRAIEDYVRYSPAGQPRWPRSLNDLLRDTRGPWPRHHLRRLYADPFTGKADWQPMAAPADPAGIGGVKSRAQLKAVSRRTGETSAPACVCAWVFVARP